MAVKMPQGFIRSLSANRRTEENRRLAVQNSMGELPAGHVRGMALQPFLRMVQLLVGNRQAVNWAGSGRHGRASVDVRGHQLHRFIQRDLRRIDHEIVGRRILDGGVKIRRDVTPARRIGFLVVPEGVIF